jgi:hypothetical protein
MGKISVYGHKPDFRRFLCDDSPWQKEFNTCFIFVQTQLFLENKKRKISYADLT